MTDDFIDLKKFEKKKQIGKGSYGKVYIVQMKSTKKAYAAKVSIEEIDKNSVKEMLNISREVNIISKLEHPSILKFIGYSPTDFKNKSRPVIITEFSPNGSLDDVLKLESKKKKIPGWDNTKKLINIYGIAAGMAYLHSHGIIHRDLKPDNIFLDDYLCPKIADFGLSKIEHDVSSSVGTIKSTPDIKGTPIYISPEIWEKKEYTPACDVYAYAYLVYEILTGQKPFKGMILIQILAQVINGDKRPEFNKKVPISFQNLINTCWSKNPKDRPTFESILEQLKNDKSFIINGANCDDYLSYIDFIEKSQKAFNSTRRIIHLSDIINHSSSTYQKVKIGKSMTRSIQKIIEEEKIIERDKIQEIERTLEFKFLSYEEFCDLDDSCQKLVLYAEENDDTDSIFLVAKSFLEGINKFPKNVEIGERYLEYNSTNGDVESIELYADLLLQGDVLRKSEEKAIELLKEAATKHNSSTSKFKLVNIILSHQSNDIKESNEDVNYVLAKQLCKEAADEGIIPAMLLYAKLSRCQRKCKYGKIFSDPKEVLKYLKMSVDHEDPDGIAYYGRLLETGYTDLKPDPNKAIMYYKKSYEKGSIAGAALLGHALFDGVGDIVKNEDEGFKLINMAFEKKDPYGAIVYCNIIEDRHGLNKFLLKNATDLGDYLAFFNAGIYYLNGKGVEKDEELALLYLKRAMMEGSARAACIIANQYRKGTIGHDLKPNLKKSLKYLKFTADNGNADDMVLYVNELTLLENANNYKDEIESYLKKGIELGNTKCMLTYGVFLFTGKIVPQNVEEGKKLVKMAADMGNKDAMTTYASFCQADEKVAFLYKQMANQNENGECLIQ